MTGPSASASARPRPELASLRIADPPDRWSGLGFAIEGDRLALGGVSVRLGGEGTGITGWSVRGVAPVEAIDGLVTTPAPGSAGRADPGAAGGSEGCSAPGSAGRSAPGSAGRSAGAAPHPNGAIGIDHVVVVTPDFDRTAAALERAGMPLRRIRTVDGPQPSSTFRQGFRRLGPAILELVEARSAPAGPAAFWGLVVIVSDLDALGARLGDRLGSPRPAVQPGRRIAALRASAGLGPRVAFMDPEPPAA